MQRRLSTRYAAIYDDLVRAAGGNSRLRAKLAAFWPQWGHDYRGFMVVGRATNGWEDEDNPGPWTRGWAPGQAADPQNRAEIIKEARRMSESDGDCPTLWIINRAGPGRLGGKKSYNTNGSALWRITRRALASLYGEAPGGAWPSMMFWTNLYKLAPSGGGNPSWGLGRTQQPHAAGLLRWEVEEAAPRRVLVLTGWDWFDPFATHLGLHLRRTEGRVYVECVGDDDRQCRWVVAKRPERRPEDAFVAEVMDAFPPNP